MPAYYEEKSDKTLTPKQRRSGSFKDGSHFRYASNRTREGYSTGYHEAAVTTDTYNHLMQAIDQGDGTHRLPISPHKNKFWGKIGAITVNSDNLKFVLANADGFRIDTAGAILSGKNGKAAGHAGSNIDRIGEPGAHDLLREGILRILQTDPNERGFTAKSVAVGMSAMVVNSIAPGELARDTVKRGTKTLKAGISFKNNYENLRTQAKTRHLQVHNDELNRDEQAWVKRFGETFMESTQQNGPFTRKVGRGGVSPARFSEPRRDGQVSGGDYLARNPLSRSRPVLLSTVKTLPLSVTSMFRANR